ncbi:hypothetical protein FXO38_10134 [Capsicum annuum]|nr:hypothetical protein FXO38_10134 [Capsicum annuum]
MTNAIYNLRSTTLYHRGTSVYNLRISTINQRKVHQVPSLSRHIRKRKKQKRKPSYQIQFFVRLFPLGKTLVIRAQSTDLVEVIQSKITLITAIPACDQRLMYRGKQLRSEQTLDNRGVQHDTTMQLVGRMLSTKDPQARQLIDDLVSLVLHMSKSNCICLSPDSDRITMLLIQFTTMTPEDNIKKARELMELFVSSSAPAALVTLYMSQDNAKKSTAYESICAFVNSFRTMLPASLCNVCTPIVLEFCKLLRGAAGLDNRLYSFCRSSIRARVEAVGMVKCNFTKKLSALTDVFLFVRETTKEEAGSERRLEENGGGLGGVWRRSSMVADGVAVEGEGKRRLAGVEMDDVSHGCQWVRLVGRRRSLLRERVRV